MKDLISIGFPMVFHHFPCFSDHFPMYFNRCIQAACAKLPPFDLAPCSPPHRQSDLKRIVWWLNLTWLVVEPYPTEKYESELGWWTSQHMEKMKKHVLNQQPLTMCLRVMRWHINLMDSSAVVKSIIKHTYYLLVGVLHQLSDIVTGAPLYGNFSPVASATTLVPMEDISVKMSWIYNFQRINFA